jgi:xanthine/uracil permease
VPCRRLSRVRRQLVDHAVAIDRSSVTITSATNGTFAANVAAVPDPATSAMMLVGFGMIGAATRYRRKSTAVSCCVLTSG